MHWSVLDSSKDLSMKSDWRAHGNHLGDETGPPNYPDLYKITWMDGGELGEKVIYKDRNIGQNLSFIA